MDNRTIREFADYITGKNPRHPEWKGHLPAAELEGIGLALDTERGAKVQRPDGTTARFFSDGDEIGEHDACADDWCILTLGEGGCDGMHHRDYTGRAYTRACASFIEISYEIDPGASRPGSSD